MQGRIGWFGALLVAAGWAYGASAQTEPDDPAREQARRHFERCVDLMENENFDAALVECQRSFDTYPTRSALFNLANCEKGLHRYVAAIRNFNRWMERYAESAPAGEIESVVSAVEQLRGFVGWLWVQSDVEGANLVVDGHEIAALPMTAPTAIEIGTHEVAVAAEGREAARQEVVLASGEILRLTLNPEPSEEAVAVVETSSGSLPVAPPSSGSRPEEGGAGVGQTWFWVTAGSAVAIAAAAGAVAGVAESTYDDFVSGGRIDAGLADRGETLDVTTWALAGVAGAVAVGAVVLIFFTDWGADETGTEPTVVPAPGGIAVRW